MPDVKQARTRKPKSTNVAFDVMRAQYAAKRDVPVEKASKSLRAAIRSHRPALEKRWPALKDHQKGDGYRDVPRKLANAIVTYGVAGALDRK